ncbi:MAG: PPE family protein [Mycobacterium sp.]|nr:MAG: PPE family protein [Mycobacterium sp.]
MISPPPVDASTNPAERLLHAVGRIARRVPKVEYKLWVNGSAPPTNEGDDTATRPPSPDHHAIRIRIFEWHSDLRSNSLRKGADICCHRHYVSYCHDFGVIGSAPPHVRRNRQEGPFAMSFFTSLPEVTSEQMFSGPGAGPMLAASAAWAALADELDTAATSFASLISDLLTSGWQSPAARTMAGVAAQYGDWLYAAASHAGGAAAGAQSVASVYEVARAAVVNPIAIAINRNRLVSLALTNIFGLNAPAIAATDGEYEEMWATNIAAMVGYHGGASAIAQQLVPWQNALSGVCRQIAPATGGVGGTALPPAPAATAVEYGLIAGLIATRLGSGIRVLSSVDTLFTATMGQLTRVASELSGPVLITQAAAQLSAVAANPALLTRAASDMSAVAFSPAILTQAAAQLSAVAAAPTAIAAVVADPALVTQAAARLSTIVANPAVLAPLADPTLLTQTAAQLSAVAANPVLLTQAAAQLSAVAANPVLLTEAAAQMSAIAANPGLIASVVSPIMLTQAASQLSAVAANPGLLTQAAGQLSAVAANPGLLTQAAGQLSAVAANPGLLTQAIEQAGGAISLTPISIDPTLITQATTLAPVATAPEAAAPALQA